MLKRFAASLVFAFFTLSSFSNFASTAVIGRNEPQVTEAEAQEAQGIVVQFTLQFAETKDLSPIVKDLYFSDFIQRYIESRANSPNFKEAPHLYFLPGLEYNSRLLTESSAADWQRFYIAGNNFLLFGFVSGLKKASDNATDIKPTDMYPASVMKLLDKNPNLANMVMRKGPSKPVSTAAEMREATATLEQADAIMREKSGSKSLLKINNKELVKVIKEDELFKPQLEVVDEELFGFPKGTRILLIKTPLSLQLMLAKDGSRLKIFWTEAVAY